MTDQSSDVRFASAFKDLEPYINDLVRNCDLTLYVSRVEILNGQKITADGRRFDSRLGKPAAESNGV